MMLKRIIGIDPGAGGGIAIFWEGGKIELHPYRDDEETYEILSDVGDIDVKAYIELVGGYVGGAGQPGSSMFRFGDGYGYYRGLLRALRIPYHKVTPQAWQKPIPGLKGLKGQQRKRALKAHAATIYPMIKTTLKTADALLIADWGSKQ